MPVVFQRLDEPGEQPHRGVGDGSVFRAQAFPPISQRLGLPLGLTHPSLLSACSHVWRHPSTSCARPPRGLTLVMLEGVGEAVEVVGGQSEFPTYDAPFRDGRFDLA